MAAALCDFLSAVIYASLLSAHHFRAACLLATPCLLSSSRHFHVARLFMPPSPLPHDESDVSSPDNSPLTRNSDGS